MCYLKFDHEAATVVADCRKLTSSDEVVWQCEIIGGKESTLTLGHFTEEP